MPSPDDDTTLDPETEAAVRRVVREELDQRDATGIGGVLRAITELGSGFVIGVLGIATVGGILIAVDAPPAAFGVVECREKGYFEMPASTMSGLSRTVAPWSSLSNSLS